MCVENQREGSRSVVALAYNRHAAVQIRQRLQVLIGDDAQRVTVMTCHGLAMRLAGLSFSGSAHRTEQRYFDDVLSQATGMLNGQGAAPDEADEQRAGRWPGSAGSSWTSTRTSRRASMLSSRCWPGGPRS